jgi:hypothetical protein
VHCSVPCGFIKVDLALAAFIITARPVRCSVEICGGDAAYCMVHTVHSAVLYDTELDFLFIKRTIYASTAAYTSSIISQSQSVNQTPSDTTTCCSLARLPLPLSVSVPTEALVSSVPTTRSATHGTAWHWQCYSGATTSSVHLSSCRAPPSTVSPRRCHCAVTVSCWSVRERELQSDDGRMLATRTQSHASRFLNLHACDYSLSWKQRITSTQQSVCQTVPWQLLPVPVVALIQSQWMPVYDASARTQK